LQNQSTYYKLIGLRQNNPEAADFLFQRVVADAASSPVDIQALLLAGAYLFNSPGDRGVSWMGVGKTILPDLGGSVRKNIPTTLISNYLSIAVAALSQPNPDPLERGMSYVALNILFPEVQSYLPALVTEMGQTLQSLTQDYKPEFHGDFSRFGKSPHVEVGTLEDRLSSIEKLPESERDGRYVSTISSLYFQGQLAKATEIVEKIRDLDLRQKMSNIVGLAQSATYIKDKKMDSAQALAKNMTGVELPLLWLNLAYGYSQNNQPEESLESARTALKASEKIEGFNGAEIALTVAGVAAKQDPFYGQSVLREAIDRFNRLQSDDERAKVVLKTGRMIWLEDVRTKGAGIGLSLTVMPGIEEGWGGLRPIYRNDRDTVRFNVLGIKQEQVLGSALIALTRIILE
jgi:tetratricopeptide (TPR) repeat protein